MFKSYNPHQTNGLTLTRTRFDSAVFEQIFNTFLVPLINPDDQLLLYRVFLNAHVQRCPKSDQKLGYFHLPLTLTLQAMKSGSLAIVSPKLKKKVSYWIQLCPHCTLTRDGGRTFPHELDSPRIATLLGNETPVFYAVSVDTLGPFHIKHSHGRKGTYQIHLLIVVDLVSGMLSSHLMPSLKKHDIVLALQDLSYKFRMPQLIITDAGSSLTFLDTCEEYQILSAFDIQLINLPPSHQFAN